MSTRTLWLRWSWRDLRQRWVLVGAIALVIALGTGTYAGLLSTSAWREQSNDASFALLDTHDVRIALSQGVGVPEGTLSRLVSATVPAGELAGVRERWVAPTQIAGPAGLLVPGEVVGTALGSGATPDVDGVHVSAGRALTAADDGRPTVVVEQGFARQNGLPARGRLRLSGGVTVRYVGHGQSPEYFLVSGGQGALPFLSQKTYGVLFTSLHAAQLITGAPGQVNDAVLVLRPGVSSSAVAQALTGALTAAALPVSATVTTRDDIDSYRVLYDDIAGDEQLWRVIALLVLAGATFAALNLTSRIVEAQRREIGIGMALGVRPRLLAVRPLLFGAQVALLGVLLGVGVGWLLGLVLRQVFVDLLPLPVWLTPFQPGVFAQAAVLGFVLPFAAVAWPVWRAVRVQPVEAIRVGHLAARGNGLVPLLRHLPLPGRSYRQVPVRNLLRRPRRTLLTALGIAAAICTLVTTIGFLDTFNATLDRSEAELMRAAPDRVAVSLTGFEPADGAVVAEVRSLPEAGSVSTGLLVPTRAGAGSSSVDLLTEVLAQDAPWTPSLLSGSLHGGLVLARKAADDLGVDVGDTVALEHPQATATGLRTVTTQVPIAGVHPNPMRVLAYLDRPAAASLGLAGTTNLLTVLPASGVAPDEVRRALLGVPHVASAESAQATIDGMRSGLEEFLGILQVAAGVTLVLALLIAFNTVSIGMDERSREHATMQAFGLPVRSVLALSTVEIVLVGLLGTAIGVAGGYGVLRWMATTTIPAVLPEIGVTAALAGNTLLWAVGLGVLTVAAAPLLTLRRLRRMDVPATLRVVE